MRFSATAAGRFGLTTQERLCFLGERDDVRGRIGVDGKAHAAHERPDEGQG
jgi:hypothetical protein